MDFDALIIECLNGSSLAQKKLFEKFAPKMMYLCLRYAKDKESAEDMLQEGFIKVFNNLINYKNNGSFEGWMRKIFVNTALDVLRKEKEFKLNTSLDDLDYMVSSSELASDTIEAEDLYKMIKELPNGYQVVFNLFAIEGYSHKEIADLLMISEETSKSQYFRARSFLRKKLEKIEIER